MATTTSVLYYSSNKEERERERERERCILSGNAYKLMRVNLSIVTWLVAFVFGIVCNVATGDLLLTCVCVCVCVYYWILEINVLFFIV